MPTCPKPDDPLLGAVDLPDGPFFSWKHDDEAEGAVFLYLLALCESNRVAAIIMS